MTEIFNYCEIAMYESNYKKKNQKHKNKKKQKTIMVYKPRCKVVFYGKSYLEALIEAKLQYCHVKNWLATYSCIYF